MRPGWHKDALAVVAAIVAATGLPAFGHGPGEVPETPSDVRCRMSAADLVANRQRDWADFEFSTDRPFGPMWFNSRSCWQQAVDVSEDYLAHGGLLTERQRAITSFHMARNLARTGDHAGAARLAAASRRSDQSADAALDWNTYVLGFYAFLADDRATLDGAVERLLQKGGQGNLTNAMVLRRAQRCFDRPFLFVETSESCAVAVEE